MEFISQILSPNTEEKKHQPKTKVSTFKKIYIESYGCQMNVNDSEIVLSILREHGYHRTLNEHEADIILLNTCAIREKAEQTIRHRLKHIKQYKKSKPSIMVGLLGCMAERLKKKLLEEEQLLDLVVGPDAYRTLPNLIRSAEDGEKMVNVLLSREETYNDIAPIRLDPNGISAFVTIMRGCNNMCSFCIVPFTRGRERSRDLYSILQECTTLINEGCKEITLLGQNVDSYNWFQSSTNSYITFDKLIEEVAKLDPKVRIRFSTSHPKDISKELLEVIAKHDNICNNIHLPIQSGSNRILQLMNRSYTREWFFQKVNLIKSILPDCSISTDIISGFCSETEEDHKATLDSMKKCQFDFAYMFFYSEREGSLAARKYKDDIALDLKKKRLSEIIDLQGEYSLKSMNSEIGNNVEVLIEGNSKKDSNMWMSRTSQNKVVLFAKGNNALTKGSYVNVTIKNANKATLFA